MGVHGACTRSKQCRAYRPVRGTKLAGLHATEERDWNVEYQGNLQRFETLLKDPLNRTSLWSGSKNKRRPGVNPAHPLCNLLGWERLAMITGDHPRLVTRPQPTRPPPPGRASFSTMTGLRRWPSTR